MLECYIDEGLNRYALSFNALNQMRDIAVRFKFLRLAYTLLQLLFFNQQSTRFRAFGVHHTADKSTDMPLKIVVPAIGLEVIILQTTMQKGTGMCIKSARTQINLQFMFMIQFG